MLKRFARLLLGEYTVYRIYRHAPPDTHETAEASGPTDAIGVRVGLLDGASEILASPFPELHALAGYAGDEALLFGVWRAGILAGAAAYWWGKRYATRNFWRLGPAEAKLVQVAIASPHRGHGLAARLIEASARTMHSLGHGSLYARVWHSHVASRRAFERAGWRAIAFVVETNPLRRKSSHRWTIPIRSAPVGQH